MNKINLLRSCIPEGVIGDWRVEHFVVTEKDVERQRNNLHYSFTNRGRYVPAGTYTRLKFRNTIVMSDTPDEIRDCMDAIKRARGNCLVNGLGLGVVVEAMLMKPEVQHVTVIEIAPAVLQLVGTHLKKRFGRRLTLIQADALTWQPPKGAKYEVVWHDIWNNICSDNLPAMHKLHRKYGRRAVWQGSWQRNICEMQR